MPGCAPLAMPVQSLRRFIATRSTTPGSDPLSRRRPSCRAPSSSAARSRSRPMARKRCIKVVESAARHLPGICAARAFRGQFLVDRVAFTRAASASSGSSPRALEARRRAGGASREDCGRDADLQRGAIRLRRRAGDQRGRRDGPESGSTSSFSPTPPIRISGSPRSAPSSRCASGSAGSARLLPASARRTRPQGRQYRRFRLPLGRRATSTFVVLDADSLMTGDASSRWPRRWRPIRTPGIIQTLPLIVNRNTLFARLQQFAARIYGPVIAAGLRAWTGRDGNYWGHNAIIRTRPSRTIAACPTCAAGRPSAATSSATISSRRRSSGAPAGRSTCCRCSAAATRRPAVADRPRRARPALVPGQPPALADHRRQGFDWASRQHFATGIMGYLASPVWMAQLLVGIVLVLQSHYIRPEYFTANSRCFRLGRGSTTSARCVFRLTMAVLLAPNFSAS